MAFSAWFPMNRTMLQPRSMAGGANFQIAAPFAPNLEPHISDGWGGIGTGPYHPGTTSGAIPPIGGIPNTPYKDLEIFNPDPTLGWNRPNKDIEIFNPDPNMRLDRRSPNDAYKAGIRRKLGIF